MLHAVLHTVVLFGTLGVVEAVQSAHKVAGDAADALKAHTLAVFASMLVSICAISQVLLQKTKRC